MITAIIGFRHLALFTAVASLLLLALSCNPTYEHPSPYYPELTEGLSESEYARRVELRLTVLKEMDSNIRLGMTVSEVLRLFPVDWLETHRAYGRLSFLSLKFAYAPDLWHSYSGYNIFFDDHRKVSQHGLQTHFDTP